MFQSKSGFGLSVTAVALAAAVVIASGIGLRPTQAASVEGDKGPQVLFGQDDDNTANTAIQPAGTAANQSLNNADVLEGGDGNDVLIGLLGSDVMLGGQGNDIIVGGPDPGGNNSDIMFGNGGNDVNLWAPGDGSEAFIGGPGKDAIIFGVTDKNGAVPVLSAPTVDFPLGVPTANVSGQGGFCTVETAPQGSGYDYLIRFVARATGNIAVTVRVKGVEQLFCTSTQGGNITFANLQGPSPVQEVVSIDDVQRENRIVGLMIR